MVPEGGPKGLRRGSLGATGSYAASHRPPATNVSIAVNALLTLCDRSHAAVTLQWRA